MSLWDGPLAHEGPKTGPGHLGTPPRRSKRAQSRRKIALRRPELPPGAPRSQQEQSQEGPKGPNSLISNSTIYMYIYICYRYIIDIQHIKLFVIYGVEDGRRGPQDRPKTAQESPKGPSKQSKRAPRRPKRRPRRPKRLPRGPQNGPRGPQYGPRGAQGCPKGPQDGSKTAPRRRQRTENSGLPL